IVFVRLPVSGGLKQLEDQTTPRAKIWEPLLQRTTAPGIHFEDYPELNGFNCPEWSHLSAGDSVEFSRRLVPIFARRSRCDATIRKIFWLLVLTSLSSSDYFSFSEKASALNSWFQIGEIHSHFYPDIGGDDRVREQFASLPTGANANRDRPSQFHLRSHLLWRRRALAHYEDAQRHSRGGRQLAISSRALYIRSGFFVCVSCSFRWNRSIAPVWRSPGHDDRVGFSHRRTFGCDPDRRSYRRPNRPCCADISRNHGSTTVRFGPDGRIRRGLGNLFATRQRWPRRYRSHRWQLSKRRAIRHCAQCHFV